MTAPDGSALEAVDAYDVEAPQTAMFVFPGAFAGPAHLGLPANMTMVGQPANTAAAALTTKLPADLADAMAALADERGVSVAALLDAARLLAGVAPDEGAAGDIRAAEAALALAGRGVVRMVPAVEADRLNARIETLEYRNKALTNALERVSFQPLDGGVREVRDAAQVFGFANEWCFDEDRVRRRFRELAPVYHPDTGVVADRNRMTQLIEARNLLIRHVRTAYVSGQWVGRKRG